MPSCENLADLVVFEGVYSSVPRAWTPSLVQAMKILNSPSVCDLWLLGLLEYIQDHWPWTCRDPGIPMIGLAA